MEIKNIPIKKIRPSPTQPRKIFDKEKISELAESIRENELIQPIVVREQGDTFQIIAGERRWRAMQENKTESTPAIIRNVDDTKAMELSLIENWQREDLTSVERESMVTALWNTGNYKSGSELARALGSNHSTINEMIKVNPIREKEHLGRIPATELIGDTLVLQPEERKVVLQKVESKELQRSDVRAFVKVIKSASDPIKEALLKPDSKITIETAQQIAQFPEPAQQKAIIKEIEKSKVLEEKGIEAYVKDKLDIVQGVRAPDITISDPQKRMVERYGRIYSDVTSMSADHVESLPRTHKNEAIKYMVGCHDHLQRELSKLGKTKVIGGYEDVKIN